MKTATKRYFFGLCVLLLGSFLGFVYIESLKMTNSSDRLSADHSLAATLPEPELNTVLSLLASFAKAHDMKTAFGYRSQDGKRFLFQMSLQNLSVVVANPIQENKYEVSSYTVKPSELSRPTTGDLINELKEDLAAIPGAKVTIEY